MLKYILLITFVIFCNAQEKQNNEEFTINWAELQKNPLEVGQKLIRSLFRINSADRRQKRSAGMLYLRVIHQVVIESLDVITKIANYLK